MFFLYGDGNRYKFLARGWNGVVCPEPIWLSSLSMSFILLVFNLFVNENAGVHLLFFPLHLLYRKGSYKDK